MMHVVVLGFGPRWLNFTEIRPFRWGPKRNQIVQKIWSKLNFYAMTMVHTSLRTTLGIKTWINSNYRSLLYLFHFTIVIKYWNSIILPSFSLVSHHISPILPTIYCWSDQCPKFNQILSKFHLKTNSLTSQTIESRSKFSEIRPFR